MGIDDAIHSNLAIPPGEYLEEVLEDLGMTKDELARRMGRPASKLSPIFKGEKSVTPDTALRLAEVVGVPAHVWTGLEAEYRLTLARQKKAREEEGAHEEELARQYPYAELAKAGEVPATRSPRQRARSLRKFFGVSSLANVPDIQLYQPAFGVGKSRNAAIKPEALAAWIRVGEKRARRMRCSPFNAGRVREAITSIRAMTALRPEDFIVPLENELAGAGVVLSICPHFSGTSAQGAVFWLGQKKAVLMLATRYKWSDIFWFSFFHEIGHILLHGRQSVIIETGERDHREKEADRFAANVLVSPEQYKTFVERGDFRLAAVKAFAREQGIAPGVVVGRLQHEGKLNHLVGNKLRLCYDWSRVELRREYGAEETWRGASPGR